jgi:hypothetical protein
MLRTLQGATASRGAGWARTGDPGRGASHIVQTCYRLRWASTIIMSNLRLAAPLRCSECAAALRVQWANEALVAALADRAMLFVLDNAEHLIDAVSALLAALLSRAPAVHWLVTSQQRLQIGGEELFRLDPPPLPPSHDQAALPAGPSLRRRCTTRHDGFVSSGRPCSVRTVAAVVTLTTTSGQAAWKCGRRPASWCVANSVDATTRTSPSRLAWLCRTRFVASSTSSRMARTRFQCTAAVDVATGTTSADVINRRAS